MKKKYIEQIPNHDIKIHIRLEINDTINIILGKIAINNILCNILVHFLFLAF